MILSTCTFLSILVFQVAVAELSHYSFPENFVFGVTTAAYQIEGGASEDGRTESIWDYNIRQNPNWIADGSNGDVACDSYHKWREDVQLIKDLGADFYRFSISWTRILPSGGKGSKINKKGVEYYNKLINKLLAENIVPLVTIYHWDLPQSLQEKGGWMSASIIEDYVYYAKTLFDLFGDRVKHWVTFNEPTKICEGGYSTDEMAPFLNASGVGGYLCSHNLLLSHGRVYREYEKLYKPTQGGQIAITTVTAWYGPKGNSDSDKQASDRFMQFMYGWHMHPIIHGNYPPIMIDRIDRISKQEGLTKSRLPKFTKSEIDMIRGSFDFICLNHYTTFLSESSDDFNQPSFFYDIGAKRSDDPKWQVSPTSGWLKRVPWGFRKLLVWIKEEYGNPPIVITENGWSGVKGLNDTSRVRYINEYLSELLKAIHEDGCNIQGYAHWSLLDNFEWRAGYSAKFGLVEVDFNSSDRTRTPRASYRLYQKIIKSRKLR